MGPTKRSQLLSRPKLVSILTRSHSKPLARRHSMKSRRCSTSTLGWLSISKATLLHQLEPTAIGWLKAVPTPQDVPGFQGLQEQDDCRQRHMHKSEGHHNRCTGHHLCWSSASSRVQSLKSFQPFANIVFCLC